MKLALALFLILPLAPAHGARARTLRTVRGCCGFALEIPAEWKVVERESFQGTGSCAVEVGPSDKRRGGLARMFTLELFEATSQNICENTDICLDDNGKWQIQGRAGAKNEAEVLETRDWRALIGVSETGNYGENGYQGMAQVFVAVLDDRRGHMASFVGDLDFRDEGVFREIGQSFRFTYNAAN